MASATRPRSFVSFVAIFTVAAGLTELSAPALAHAEDRGAFPLDKPRERRSGLVVALASGVLIAGGSGYPNSATKLNDPRYYAASGVVTGSTTSLMVMGALSDYLNFGFWGGGGQAENDDWKITSGGGGVRVEAFPLFYWVPKLRDLGVFGQFGVGSVEMKAKHGLSPGGDGVQSFLGAGSFYEFRLFNPFGTHFTLAPSLEYQSILSQTFSQHGAAVGIRIALYGGP